MIVTKLKTADIVVKDRLRGVDPQKVDRLKESITRMGLINPITVSGGVLVAGLHRLTAYIELGYDEIDCHVVDADELLSIEMEIDENLHRNELTVLERGRMEAIKKKHEGEWSRRQLKIEYYQTPDEVKYELAKIEGIAPEAKEKIKGTPYENDKTFLLDLAELSKDSQISVTRDLSVRCVGNIIKNRAIKERFPDKDKNQIKFQTDDNHIAMAQKFIKMYGWRSMPDLARKLFEAYLNAFFKEEREPADDEILVMFDDLSGNIAKDEYQSPSREDFQDVKRGTSI